MTSGLEMKTRELGAFSGFAGRGGSTAHTDADARFRILTDAMPQMVWSTLPDGHHDYYNARWYEFTGAPVGSTDGDGWNGMFHPDDQQRAWSAWQHALATGEPYEIEYRLRHRSGEYRWTLGRALPLREADGKIVRWIGTCTDIHDTKMLAEERKLVAQELNHRIKNIFAVVGSIISLSARAYPSLKPYTETLLQRVFALAKAHEFVRAQSTSGSQRSLQGLIEALLEPFREGEHKRVVFLGQDVGFDDAAATPLALLFHELATNAAKYGALSQPDGRIEVVTEALRSGYHVCWKERGGLARSGKPAHLGFGSKLIALSVEGQLEGSIEHVWESDGLRAEIVLPQEALARTGALRRAPDRKP